MSACGFIGEDEMTSIAYPNTVAPAAERRTLSIAFVVALHVAVIYTILVAMRVVPSPLPDTPTRFRVIDQTPPIDNHPPPPLPSPTMAHPEKGAVTTPFIPTDGQPKPGPGAILVPPGQPGIADAFEGPSAIAGTHTIPLYPALERRLDHEGTVVVAISVDAQGAITGVRVDRSSGFDGLDAAAVEWVKDHWRFKPATKGGAPVASISKASVVFRLTAAAR
jgi:protein TonB